MVVARAGWIAVVGVALLCGVSAPAAVADNAIQRENALPGTTAWNGPGSSLIELYASQIGAAPGDEIDVHVNTHPDPARYRLEIYRLGWYGGAGGRLITCLPSCSGDEQGRPQPVPTTTATDGPPLRANWPVTDTFQTGADWTSGYYEIRAVLTSGPDAGRGSVTYFILRETPHTPASQILVQVPVNTWEAYNQWGGKSLYDFDGPRAHEVSFDRPWGRYANSPLWWEIQNVRFLEREGYDVSYQTDVDTDLDPSSLLDHRLVMTDGHDEYWSKNMRDGFDAALAGGTNLAFMNSNTGYWQIRYEDNDRTIVAYKDASLDPEPDPMLKTVMFRQLGRPECMLEGDQMRYQPPHQTGPHDYTVVAPANDPWLANTGLTPGTVIPDLVGDEWDGLNPWPDSCIHPGLTVLLHFALNSPVGDADAVRFTAPSGARVFASGAQRFSWGLDTFGTQQYGHNEPASPGLQQFVRNMLDDLTRPQAPPSVWRVNPGVPGMLQIRTGWPADPRIVGRLVYRIRNTDPPVLVCSGHSACLVPRMTVPGNYSYEAEYVDIWGRTSAPTFSTVFTLHQA